MNSYELFRNFFNWAFEHPHKIKPIHVAIFSFAIEHNNRLGWRKIFGFPSQMTMEAIGVKKHQTYSKALNELEEWGFITFHERSKNQYSTNIIQINALPKNGKARGKALDKAMTKHKAKQGRGTAGINKPINQLTNKPENREILALDFLKSNFPSQFDTFEMQFKSSINNYKKFCDDFNDTVIHEGLDFDEKLFGRLRKYARNWIENQNRYNENNSSTSHLSKLI